MSDFRKTIKAFDLFEYFEDRSVSFKVMSGGTFYYVNCWNCGKSKMFIHNNEYKGFHRCWVCGHKGDLFDLISHYDQIDRREAIQFVLGNHIELGAKQEDELLFEFKTWSRESKREKNKEIQLAGNVKLLTSIPESECYHYAEIRGITREMMKKFHVHGSDGLKRIFFPIYEDGMLVGWQARAINDWIQPKLMSSTGFKKSLCLFNYDNVKMSESIVIVEGPIDALKAHKHNSVALLGKSMSNEQFLLIQSLPHLKKVYIALDPDAAENARELGSKLVSHFDVHMVNLPGNTDIGDCDEEEVDYYIRISRPYSNQDKLSFGKMLEVLQP